MPPELEIVAHQVRAMCAVLCNVVQTALTPCAVRPNSQQNVRTAVQEVPV